MSEEERISSGTVLIEQGEDSHELFILKQGSVGVYIDDVLVDTFNARNSVIGEMSCILDRPRTATVKARSNCTIMRYPAADMVSLIKDCPETAELVMHSLATRLDKANVRLTQLTKEAHERLWQD